MHTKPMTIHNLLDSQSQLAVHWFDLIIRRECCNALLSPAVTLVQEIHQAFGFDSSDVVHSKVYCRIVYLDDEHNKVIVHTRQSLLF